MRKIIFGALLLLGPLSNSFCSDLTPDGIFKAANLAYEQGNLQEAESRYLELVSQGYEGVSLYYNLGNLYYRKGDRGKSVLWYERAKRLAPRDSDISFNLSLATSHMKQSSQSWFEQILLVFTNQEVLLALALLSWVFFGILGARLLRWIAIESTWSAVVLWISGPLLLLVTVWFCFHYVIWHRVVGVVINPPGEVRNGPGTDYSVGFTLPEGSRVLILDKRPEWIQIGISEQGLKGWIPALEIQPIEMPWSNSRP